MSLYLADERGHLADVGSASRYAKFLDWADQQNDAAVRQFADHGSTTQTEALAKALEAAKGSKRSLIKLIADASRVAIGVITVQDSEQEMIQALWPDKTGFDDHGRLDTATMRKYASVRHTREQKKASRALIKDIRQNGIKTPIRIAYDAKLNRAFLFDGHHRLDAAERIGLSHVPVKIEAIKLQNDPTKFMYGHPIESGDALDKLIRSKK